VRLIVVAMAVVMDVEVVCACACVCVCVRGAAWRVWETMAGVPCNHGELIRSHSKPHRRRRPRRERFDLFKPCECVLDGWERRLWACDADVELNDFSPGHRTNVCDSHVDHLFCHRQARVLELCV
jgi:hypothetical protein